MGAFYVNESPVREFGCDLSEVMDAYRDYRSAFVAFCVVHCGAPGLLALDTYATFFDEWFWYGVGIDSVRAAVGGPPRRVRPLLDEKGIELVKSMARDSHAGRV